MKTLHALWLRATDLVKSFGFPPYVVVDHQSYDHLKGYYSLKKAIAAGDCTGLTKGRGTVHPVVIGVGVASKQYAFSRDRKGRIHLPRALRDRIL